MNEEEFLLDYLSMSDEDFAYVAGLIRNKIKRVEQKENEVKELELSEFINLINEIKESEETITISEFFNRCINKAREENINEKWFIQFKAQAECELKIYADERSFPIDYILRNNHVERTENGLIVLLGKEIKYKDKIFEIYFPSEFNNNFVLSRSIY